MKDSKRNTDRPGTTWNPALYNEKHAYVYDHGEELIALLNPKSHERILDLGCGAGQLTSRLSDLAKEAIGLDRSPEMIAEARAQYPHIAFQVGDAADFMFDDKFDAIFSNAALHWVKDQAGAIRCMANNLARHGRIVLEFGGKGNVQTIVNQLRRSLQRRRYSKQAGLDLWFFPSVGEYTTALERAGFRVTMARHFDRPTVLADEETGIIDWLSMFGVAFFTGVHPAQVEEIKKEVQEMVKPRCLIDGKWYADYKRIRIVAEKPA